MTAIDFKPNMRVLYVPMHAYGDKGHPDCERGTVSSTNDENVFVKFDRQLNRLGWHGTTSQSCCPEDLLILEDV